MTTTHIGRLIDRHVTTGRIIIRAKLDNGRIIDVRVREQDRDAAAALWGGNCVRYEYRGGRAFFSPHDD